MGTRSAFLLNCMIWGCLAMSIPFLYVILSGGTSYAYDVDDMLRAIQIKDVLADGQWRDLQIPGIAMPDPYISPWSRLIDFIYAVPTWILTPVFGMDKALSISLFIVPILLFIPFFILFKKLTEFFASDRVSVFVWILTILFFVRCVIEFSPTRIDHHNMQLLLLFALCWGLLTSQKIGGYVMGLAIILSIAVGLETSPIIFVALFGLAGFAWWGDTVSTQKMKALGTVLASTTFPVAILLLGWKQLNSPSCDVFSLSWATGMTGGGIILFCAPLIWNKIDPTKKFTRLAALAIPAIILCLICAVLFPVCLGGPMHMVDPVAKTFWWDNVDQEHSIFWHLQRPGYEFRIALLALSVSFLALTLKFTWPVRKQLSRPNAIYLIVTVFTLIFGTFYPRYEIFYVALIAVLLPYALNQLATLRRQGVRPFYTALLGFVFPALFAIFAYTSLVKTEHSMSLIEAMQTKSCLTADEPSLAQIPPSRILAPLGLSFGLFLEQDKHDVAAIQFHRSSPGIRRIGQAFGDFDTQTRQAALTPYDYVAICKFNETHTGDDQAPVYAALMKGGDWPGFVELTDKSSEPFSLYRIDHKNLK